MDEMDPKMERKIQKLAIDNIRKYVVEQMKLCHEKDFHFACLDKKSSKIMVKYLDIIYDDILVHLTLWEEKVDDIRIFKNWKTKKDKEKERVEKKERNERLFENEVLKSKKQLSDKEISAFKLAARKVESDFRKKTQEHHDLFMKANIEGTSDYQTILQMYIHNYLSEYKIKDLVFEFCESLKKQPN